MQAMPAPLEIFSGPSDANATSMPNFDSPPYFHLFFSPYEKLELRDFTSTLGFMIVSVYLLK